MILVYFLLGAAILFGSMAVNKWAEAEGSQLAWYHWVGVAVVALWTLFVAAWIGTSLGEGYARAAGVGALIWGLIDIVLFILLRLWIVKSVTGQQTAVKA